ncbi:DNA helicase UvrD [Candidatus Wolfebacteria bacterium]|nr:DNA helicase UvrD [Candidatus Wolfebacteria bacterium]
MKFFADFHIHSKYSRATSKIMILEEFDRVADDKGILLMGTGDFTHPEWFKEIKNKLEPVEPGLFKLKEEFKRKTLKGTMAETRFMLTAEISGIYSKNGKVRRVHNIIFSPDIETAEKINEKLSLIGNLSSDGRPILGLDSEKLAEIVFNINQEAVIVPAHIWTPWFSMFGSMSGFDSIEECFGKYAKNIFAIETGLSSDPQMNRRLSKFDNIALISNSDSHSLAKIGREANIFDVELSYANIIGAIKFQNRKKFLGTIEFFPEEGKYHFDGHRDCGVWFSPEETKQRKNICPKCGRHLTIGVMSRVNDLSDRKVEFKISGSKKEINGESYFNLIPLSEIIAEAFEVGENTKRVKKEYENLIKNFGNELKILLEISESELKSIADNRVAEGIKRVREGKVKIRPGYDGEYGEISIFNDKERK